MICSPKSGRRELAVAIPNFSSSVGVIADVVVANIKTLWVDVCVCVCVCVSAKCNLSRAGCSIASASSPFGPPDATAPFPGVGVVEGLGDESERTHWWNTLLVLILALFGLGLLLGVVHLALEVGKVLGVEEGVALDRQG